MDDFSHFTALRVEEREDRVHARMDRPGVRNAIDQTMVDEFHELCAHLEREPKILIISGTQVESKREPGRSPASSPPARTSDSCASAAATTPCAA